MTQGAVGGGPDKRSALDKPMRISYQLAYQQFCPINKFERVRNNGVLRIPSIQNPARQDGRMDRIHGG